MILPHKFQDAEKFNLQFSDFSEITETADKLRWLRYQKGLRQRDVADYAGIYRSTYIHYEEYGKDFYSPKHMEKIAQLFEVPVERLLDDYNLFLRNGQGKQIKAIRMKLGLTQREYADNLTSVDQYYGTQSKCCPHYVGVHEGDEVVCLTEGVMKSDLAYSFAQGSPYECGFVGLTGIPSYSQYERALEELDSIGVKRINVMVDSDYQVKEEVRKARDRYIEMGAAAGFEMAPITWTQKQKGVDDLYKHLFRDK